MEPAQADELPPEVELALSYTPESHRAKFRALFAFDQRLARIVAGTTEVMLGQMRLAWWREQLAVSPEERPQGDAVLNELGQHWQGSEGALTSLIDSWELMVATDQLSVGDVKQYAIQRSAPFEALVTPSDESVAASISAAIARYVFADAANGVSNNRERALFVEEGLERSGPGHRLPKELRGLAVLQALALRSLKRGGRPLMEGRGAALTAIRAAILRR